MGVASVKVGCCGFPVGRERYFQAFTVVEVQQTFYQPPRPQTASRWRDEAPDGFEFTLKAWQLITHEASSPTYRRLRMPLRERDKKQVGAFRWTGPVRRAWDETLHLARLLGAEKVLFQCPASFKPTEENKDRLRQFFASIDREGIICIWEPRGQWQPEEIARLCRELDLRHCTDPHRARPVTGGMRYFRLHGIGGYRHRYTDEELRTAWAVRAKGAATYFMFNNVSMFHDARRFRRLIEEECAG